MPVTVAVALVAFGWLRTGSAAPRAWEHMPRFESRPVGDAVELAGLARNREARIRLRIKADHLRVVWADGTNEALDDQVVHATIVLSRGADGRYVIRSVGDVAGRGFLADVVELALARVPGELRLTSPAARVFDRALGATIRHGEANGVEVDDRTERLTFGGRGRGWAGYRVVSIGRRLARIDLLGGGRFEVDPKRLPMAVRLLTGRLGAISTIECNARSQVRLGINGGRAGLPAAFDGEVEFRAEGRKGRRTFRASGMLLVRTLDWVRARKRQQL